MLRSVQLLLLLFCLCRGLPISKDDKLKPRSVSISMYDNFFKIGWQEVKGSNKDPVIGYKVKVWEVPNIKYTKHMLRDDGTIEDVEKEIPEPMDDEGPSGVPEVFITPANVTEIAYNNRKKGVAYEYRVQAITKTKEGPPSGAMRTN